MRPKERDQLEVYDVTTYSQLRRLTVPDLRSVTDMTSCTHFFCVYISDHHGECIHSLGVEASAFTRWSVEDRPSCLSVNASHNVLAACPNVRKIKEFSSHGDLLREIKLPDDVIHPWHTIQTRENEFIVCHGDEDDAVHCVCKISADGRHIVHSHGGQRGSGHDQYDGPFHLAVDRDEFVFVADCRNRRVRLLSPTLRHVRNIVSHDQLKWRPFRLYFDVLRSRLYVADNELKEIKYKSSRVVVFSA